MLNFAMLHPVGQRPLPARRAKRKGFSEHASMASIRTEGADAVVGASSRGWVDDCSYLTYNYGLY